LFIREIISDQLQLICPVRSRENGQFRMIIDMDGEISYLDILGIVIYFGHYEQSHKSCLNILITMTFKILKVFV